MPNLNIEGQKNLLFKDTIISVLACIFILSIFSGILKINDSLGLFASLSSIVYVVYIIIANILESIFQKTIRIIRIAYTLISLASITFIINNFHTISIGNRSNDRITVIIGHTMLLFLLFSYPLLNIYIYHFWLINKQNKNTESRV